jgi:GNAT superfamily N-acetyltransferase
MMPELKYWVDIYDYHHGQLDGSIYADDQHGNRYGKLNFAQMGSNTYIQFITVAESFRRHGIAIAMIKKLRQEFPNTSIKWTMTTESGEGLRQAWIHKRYTEYNPHRGELMTIRVEGQDIAGSYLGAGHYVRKAVLSDNKVYLIMKKQDLMKDALAENEFDTPHIPPVERIYDNVKDEYIYTMPYYKPISAKDREAWSIMRELNRAKDVVWRNYHFGGKTRDRPIYTYWYEMGNDIISEAKVPQSVKEALTELLNAAGNYGSVMFEFDKRNVGVDELGRIIFRDIIFDIEKLHKERYER